jgi:hypothetical protein
MECQTPGADRKEASIAVDDTDSPSDVGTRSRVARLDGPNPGASADNDRQDQAREQREPSHRVAWHIVYQGLMPLFGPIALPLRIVRTAGLLATPASVWNARGGQRIAALSGALSASAPDARSSGPTAVVTVPNASVETIPCPMSTSTYDCVSWGRSSLVIPMRGHNLPERWRWRAQFAEIDSGQTLVVSHRSIVRPNRR